MKKSILSALILTTILMGCDEASNEEKVVENTTTADMDEASIEAENLIDEALEVTGEAAEMVSESTETLEAIVETVEEVVAEAEVEAVTITISSNDQMKYSKSILLAKAGQEVTLTLTHTGKMAKTVMGHNLVILAKGADVPAFARRAMTAKDNDYIPKSDDIIAHTGLVGGGESSSVTFIAPESGTYDFICSFPGHYGIMKGKFIVE